MTPERWREVTQIYGAVLSRAPERRAAAVAELCGADDELRREIESLLESQHGATLLERLASEHPSVMQMLTIGSQIGVFRIDSLLGVGGMGEVYRARDTKLNRDVAIKILPPVFANDPDRLARFKREAQVLASLNHQNIGAIYGFEDSGTVHALVLELVEGDTLADRLSGHPQGSPLPILDAVAIARQIADALEAAHEQGIIHRDLKPANIKVRDDGTVKVLDFGLAKIAEADGAGGTGQAGRAGVNTQSPTITTPAMTAAGMILGTAAYMSPEQAKGRPADKRSDIWSFGCVLYEMLTGKRAFDGEDVSDTLANVLKSEPDWSRLPALSPSVRLMIQRALEKDRQKRLGDFSTIRFLLTESPVFTPASESSARRARGRTIAAVAASALIAAAVVFAGFILRTPPSAAVVRLQFPLPAGVRFTNTGRQFLAISPDARYLAFTAGSRLWVKSMAERDARPLTAGQASDDQASPYAVAIVSPAFSPDSQFVAFQSGGALRRIAVTGGSSVPIVQTVGTIFGMTWTEDGIYYIDQIDGPRIDGPNRVRRVLPSGEVVTIAESKNDEEFYGPQPLPRGRGVLVTVAKGLAATRWDQAQVVVLLPSGERRRVTDAGSDGRYLPNGDFAYSVGGVVYAAPFDLNLLQMTAPAVMILDGVTRGFPTTSASQYSVSSSGTLAYVPGPPIDTAAGRALGIFGVDGTEVPLSAKLDQYEFPRASHDGKQLAVGAYDGREGSIWVLPVDGASDRRKLVGGGINRYPIWSPDDRQVAFQSDGHGTGGIFWQAADGHGSPQRITTAEGGVEHIPAAFTPDGATILFEQLKAAEARYSLWSVDIKTGKPTQLIEAQSQVPLTPALTPNGKWLAYHVRDVSNVPARDTVWVRPFPITTDAWEVSSEGTSHHPLWLADDQLLIVIGSGQIVVREIKTSGGIAVGKSRPAPQILPTLPPASLRSFDLLPGGRIVSDAEQGLRFGSGTAAGIDVVQNWFEELKQKKASR